MLRKLLILVFLILLKLEFKGFSNGFLPSVLEMPRGSDFVMLGIFPLMEKQPLSFTGSCRSLAPAFRRGVALRRSLQNLNIETRGILKGENLENNTGSGSKIREEEDDEGAGGVDRTTLTGGE